jgi:hypothetical protein
MAAVALRIAAEKGDCGKLREQPPTQAEAKTMWDRQRAYDGGVAERKAERDREKELDRANKGMQSERFREKHRSKIPKKKR